MEKVKKRTAKFSDGDLDAKLKVLEIKEKSINIIETKDRLIIDSIYVLKSLLTGLTPDQTKTFSSDTCYKPIFESEQDEIKDKIMELVKKL